MYGRAMLWQLSCNSTGAGDWLRASLCGSALLSSLFMLTNAARTCSRDNSSLQALPAASRHIRSYPPFPKMLPTCQSPPLLYQTYSCLLYAKAQSQIARINFCLTSKGTIITVCFLVWLGAVFLLITSLLKLGGQGQISSCFLHLSLPRFSHSLGPQIHVPKEDFLFCFPVAVPTSIAIVMADAPVMEKLCFSLYLCVCACLLVFAQMCALGRVCVVHIKARSADRYLECSSRRVYMQVGACKRCVFIYGAGPILEMWV